jgi:xylose isomerase
VFPHAIHVSGASTNPDAHVFAFAAQQVKKAMEITHFLGGENYVFWGGREGYQSLLNTDVKREIDHLAAFLRLAVEHKQAIGFGGQLLIEPKPKEPTAHQLRSFVCWGFRCLPFVCQCCSISLKLGRTRYEAYFTLMFMFDLALSRACVPSLRYDYDAQTVWGFLKSYQLDAHYKVNIEPNHTTLAGHSFEHDIEVASRFGYLGSIDSNTGMDVRRKDCCF